MKIKLDDGETVLEMHRETDCLDAEVRLAMTAIAGLGYARADVAEAFETVGRRG